MKNTKRRLELFSFYNHTDITKHLEKMAQKGWMIERIANFGWIYRRIEPKTVHFAISYYPKASEFDPEPTAQQKDFLDFCAHSGWKLACLSAQMQIFYNEQETPVPIDTDPVLEVETIHKAVWKSFFPAQIFLMILAVIMEFFFFMSILGNPIAVLADPVRLFSGTCWLLVMVLVVTELIAYYRWHKKAVPAAEQGFFLDTPNTTPIQTGAMVILGVCILYLLVNVIASANAMLQFVMAAMAVSMVLLFLLVDWLKRFLKKVKASRNVNRVVTFGMAFVLTYAMMGAVTMGTLKLNQEGFFDQGEERYRQNGMWKFDDDLIPLRVEDLLDLDSEGYIYIRGGGGDSIFLSEHSLEQYPDFDLENWSDFPTLEYTIVDVKMPFLYDTCKNQMIKNLTQSNNLRIPYELRDRLEPVDANPWGAREAYYVVNEHKDWESNHYLLCYEGRLVDIEFDWEVMGEQKALVGQRIG